MAFTHHTTLAKFVHIYQRKKGKCMRWGPLLYSDSQLHTVSQQLNLSTTCNPLVPNNMMSLSPSGWWWTAWVPSAWLVYERIKQQRWFLLPLPLLQLLLKLAIGTINFHCATIATDYSFKMGVVVSSRSCHEWERGVMRGRVERTKQQVTVDGLEMVVW